MNEFLLEIYSEEIPARMQLAAQEQARVLWAQLLDSCGAVYGEINSFIATQRLCICVKNLEKTTKTTYEVKRGPKVGAPDIALAGFAKSTNQTKDQWQEKQGYWFADLVIPGRPIVDILPLIVNNFLDSFSWPKSMRWYNSQSKNYTRYWVRPIRSILCVYDEQPLIFPVNDLEIETGNKTYGHRFLSPAPLAVSNFADYQQQLANAFVIIDHQQRQGQITAKLNSKATALGIRLQQNKALLAEVAGLVDFPNVYVGKIDEKFMSLPGVVLTTSMRVHQKYFSFEKQGALAPYFGIVSNLCPENPETMLRGYEKVLQARLTDAVFFYQADRKAKLVSRNPKLDKLVFHEKLGTIGQKVKRLETLMENAALRAIMGSDAEHGKRAANLCKSDLLTQMVGEFPELQGIIGEIYAGEEGENPAVATALREYYQPIGASDDIPKSLVGTALSLADKVDTLVGFIGVGIKPTGSKDPFALRRAALGIIRILLAPPRRDFDLVPLIAAAAQGLAQQGFSISAKVVGDVIAFLSERLAVYLQKQGLSCIAAVIATFKLSPNLCDIKGDINYNPKNSNYYHIYNIRSFYERSLVLENILKTPRGLSLKALYKRAHGITEQAVAEIDVKDILVKVELLEKNSTEEDLHNKLQSFSNISHELLQQHNYEELINLLVDLKQPIDNFLETTRIYGDNQVIQNNRLGLLIMFLRVVNKIADFRLLMAE